MLYTVRLTLYVLKIKQCTFTIKAFKSWPDSIMLGNLGLANSIAPNNKTKWLHCNAFWHPGIVVYSVELYSIQSRGQYSLHLTLYIVEGYIALVPPLFIVQYSTWYNAQTALYMAEGSPARSPPLTLATGAGGGRSCCTGRSWLLYKPFIYEARV